MGLFKNLFGKPGKSPSTSASEGSQLPPEWNSLDDLLPFYGALSFEKQQVFAEIIGSGSWQLDMQQGRITFGESTHFPIQIIGSLSFNDLSFMWGWANDQSGIPENLLVQSRKLKELGDQKGIESLSARTISVEEGFEHTIGMIACGLFNSDAYYCANYGQGTLVCTISDPQIPSINLENINKIPITFPQFISSVEVDHKPALVAYLKTRNMEVLEKESRIIGKKGTARITGIFDDQGRMTNMEVDY